MKPNTRNFFISKARLVSTWKEFRRKPNKIFVRGDFNEGFVTAKNHLQVLLKMGLIEQVPVVYNLGGKKFNARRETKGYRLKRGLLK